MVSIVDLWLPIILSGVAVFVVSSVIHMVLSYHSNDFKQIPGEDAVMTALRPFNVPPGDYVMPYAGSMKVMGSPEFQKKQTDGPVGFFTVYPNGPMSMGKSLSTWFLYSLVVGVFAGYIGGQALAPGADYLKVFQFVGTSAFMGYAMALTQNSIWYRRDWSTTLKSMFDGLVYALVTAGMFGWLWPGA